MNRFLFSLLLLSVLAASGCSGRKFGWYKPGVLPDQVARDTRECLKKVRIRQNVDNYDEYRRSRIGRDGRNNGGHDRFTMNSSAHVPIADRDHLDGWEDDRRSEADYNIKSCMEDKGYRWKLKEF